MSCYWVSLLIAALVTGSASGCDLNSTEPLLAAVKSVHGSQEPRQVLLSNNSQLNLANAPGVLAMHSADDLALLGQITLWPTATQNIATIKAQPAVVDFNYDGNADAVYAVDITGLVWYSAINHAGFTAPALVADFSQLQAEFHQPLRLVQYAATPSAGVVSRQVLLLLVASTADEGDMLLALKHQPQQTAPVDISALTDRTDISADEQTYGISEQLWQAIQQGAGWYIRLAQKVTVLPQVYAGVIYFAAADSSAINPDCSFKDDTTQQLYAVHMHHAGMIYANRQRLINTLANASLALVADAEGELQLILQNEQQQHSAITDLLTISEDCADCVAELTAGQFPRLIRLAIFQAEPGAH
jgi:hypothetical protein